MPRTPGTPETAGLSATPRSERSTRTSRTRRTPRDAAAVPLAAAPGPLAATLDRAPIAPGAVVPIPTGLNPGLSAARYATMLQVLGMPRDVVDDKCREVTNEPLKSLLVLKDVGPFRVTGLRPAVDSLKGVMDAVRAEYPEVYRALGTAGMLCVRRIAGSDKLSNHSWGCAIDLSINGALDGLGAGRRDGRTLAGLAAIAPIFNAAGWYWGVGFSSFEDGMHFEVAEETVRAWHAGGKLGQQVSARTIGPSSLSIGDRGAAVRRLQEALAARGFDILSDGIFGPITHALVVDFQASNGLVPDGIAGPETMTALGLA